MIWEARMAETTIVSSESKSLLPSSSARISSTCQHPGAFSLREAPEDIITCSGDVGAGPYPTYEPDFGNHSACRSKQPQTLSSVSLVVQPSCSALLRWEPGCKPPSLQLNCSGNPPMWVPWCWTSLMESKWLPVSLLGERKEAGRRGRPLLSFESSGGFPYAVWGLQPQMRKVSARNHLPVSGKIRLLLIEQHMRAQRSSADGNHHCQAHVKGAALIDTSWGQGIGQGGDRARESTNELLEDKPLLSLI